MTKLRFLVTMSQVVLFFCPAFGQSPLVPLQKGDTIPNLQVNVSVGDSVHTMHLRDLKGKAVILDFWATYCVECVASMPRMLELQKKFGDQVQIILVTANSDEKINALFQKLSQKPATKPWLNAAGQLPLVKNDSILSLLLPHKAFPTHVWLDRDQVVRAIAYGSGTNEENLEKFLTDKPVKFHEEHIINLDVNKPLSWFCQDGSIADQVGYYSLFLSHLERGDGDVITVRWNSDSISKKDVGVVCINTPILWMYQAAYRDVFPLKPFIPFNRMVIESDRPEKFHSPKDIFRYFSWAQENTYCYGLKVPAGVKETATSIMRRELDRFFNINSSVQTRKMKCFVLNRIASVPNIKSMGGTQQFQSKGGRLIIRNMEMKQLFMSLGTVVESKFSNPLFFDESDFKENIDINIPWKDDPVEIDFLELRKIIQEMGFDIVPAQREIPMLVIKDLSAFSRK